MELLLNRTEKRGVTRYLLRWRGHTSADDERLREESSAAGPSRALSGAGGEVTVLVVRRMLRPHTVTVAGGRPPCPPWGPWVSGTAAVQGPIHPGW
jgi:hypothetical protein